MVHFLTHLGYYNPAVWFITFAAFTTGIIIIDDCARRAVRNAKVRQLRRTHNHH
jgi:hypothetical protein